MRIYETCPPTHPRKHGQTDNQLHKFAALQRSMQGSMRILVRDWKEGMTQISGQVGKKTALG